jgi:RNA polymerase sigma-70 factor (ECF subfamily)
MTADTFALPLFDDLIDRHGSALYGYLVRLLGDDVLAQDALQETLIRTWKAYPRLSDASNLRAYMFRIATNVANDLHKQIARERGTVARLVQEAQIAGASSSDLEQWDQMQALAQAVQNLPLKQRGALILRKYQGFSYAEVSRVLDCSPDAARANVYQALRTLRAMFNAEEERLIDEQG